MVGSGLLQMVLDAKKSGVIRVQEIVLGDSKL